MRAYAESSPVTADDASYFGASWFSISASAADFHSTHSVNLLFLLKAAAVVMSVEFVCIQDYKERREGVYARDELNIQANAPHFCLKVVCKKGGVFSGAYGTCF